MEYRAFRADGVTEDDQGAISGLIAPYNVRTQIGGEKYGWKEEIAPGTFSKSLRERDIVALDNHDPHRPLARTSAGTLVLSDQSEGLRGRAVPPDTTYAQDLQKNVRAKNYGGWSFGFEVVKDEWRDDQGKPADRYDGTHRILREVKLIEVSPVTFPAYTTTSIQARDSLLAEREARGREAGEEPEAEGAVCARCAAELEAQNESPSEEGRQEPESATPETADANEALDWLRSKRHAMQAAEFSG